MVLIIVIIQFCAKNIAINIKSMRYCFFSLFCLFLVNSNHNTYAKTYKRINDFYKLMQVVDKYRPTDRRGYKYRDVKRHEYVPQNYADALFNSDTLHIFLSDGGRAYDFIVGAYFESVRGDSVHYHFVNGRDSSIRVAQFAVVDELFSKGNYMVIPYRKNDYNNYEVIYKYIKVVRRNGHFSFTSSLFYFEEGLRNLYLIQE